MDKVFAAADRLGYVRDTSAANLAKQRQYRFAFILPDGPSQFVEALESTLNEASSYHVAERTVVETIRVPQRDPHAIVRTLQGLGTEKLDGIALMVPETPQVRDAVARLKDAGLAIVALVSDLPNSRRDYFLGVNSVAAGRTAAQLMGRFAQKPGEILVVTNSIHSRDSLERRVGFDEVIAAEFPHLTVLPSVEAYDDPVRMGRILEQVFNSREQLAGIYSVGSGNSALLDHLRRHERQSDLHVIAHELTPATYRALSNDEIAAVIAHNVGHLIRGALRVLRALCDDLLIYEAQEQARIEIFLRENLP